MTPEIVPEKKYDGWLISPNFLKRSAAVFGHYFVFSLIIGFFIFLFFLILGVSLFSIFLKNIDFKQFSNGSGEVINISGGSFNTNGGN